jgi:hypothetical protein
LGINASEGEDVSSSKKKVSDITNICLRPFGSSRNPGYDVMIDFIFLSHYWTRRERRWIQNENIFLKNVGNIFTACKFCAVNNCADASDHLID